MFLRGPEGLPPPEQTLEKKLSGRGAGRKLPEIFCEWGSENWPMKAFSVFGACLILSFLYLAADRKSVFFIISQ